MAHAAVSKGFMLGFILLLLPLAGRALSGGVSAVKTVVTAPVKAVGQVADWSTTSQEESDRNRGRAMRQREANLSKLTRQRDKAAEKCSGGDQDQCRRAAVPDNEIEAVAAAPFEPRLNAPAARSQRPDRPTAPPPSTRSDERPERNAWDGTCHTRG